ncbi:hypothetical protein NL676_023652 [Syzygium grande]|nr:hypothetical protein NL676_023652 [Syzygium grande]
MYGSVVPAVPVDSFPRHSSLRAPRIKKMAVAPLSTLFHGHCILLFLFFLVLCRRPSMGLRRLPQLRGEDTRAGFVSHLTPPSAASESASSSTTSSSGETISLSLERAIECSRIAIVVFSPNFPASTWCLQELAKILEMQDSRGQLVRPVFFHVDPSDVRKQTGVFAAIMAKHEEVFGGDGSERVKKWRDALRKAVNLSGWHLGHG